MKKIIKTILFILSISLIVTSCTTNNKEEAKIDLILKVSNLTEEEFKSVGTKDLENPTKDDFKNIEFKLDIEYSNKISNKKIEVPNIKDIINSKYGNRYWFGESSSKDNKDENTANYNEKIMFYSKGLSDEEIKGIFKASEVKISWITDNDKYQEKIFNLADVIEFR